MKSQMSVRVMELYPLCNKGKNCVFILCIVLAVSIKATNDTSSGYYGKKAVWLAYLEFATEAIGEARNISVTLHDPAGKCGQKEALMSSLAIADEMINRAKINFPTIDNCYILPQPFLDCSDLLRMGHRRSGVYTVSPRKKLTEKKAFDVYCDMETDGGGWTVIQRSGDFQYPVNFFFKDWESYKEGFGDLEREFWLGNDKIFALTNQEIYSAKFDLVDVENNARYAHYDAFWIDGENSKYKLHISNYSGDAGDSMDYQNNQMFSTKDQDNDNDNGNCAQIYKGGWWFKDCPHTQGENFNGTQGVTKGKIWRHWKGYVESLARTVIKIRPKNFRP